MCYKCRHSIHEFDLRPSVWRSVYRKRAQGFQVSPYGFRQAQLDCAGSPTHREYLVKATQERNDSFWIKVEEIPFLTVGKARQWALLMAVLVAGCGCRFTAL